LIVWDGPSTTNPHITYSVKTIKDYTPDPTVAKVVERHLNKVKALELAPIYRNPAGSPPLSSKGMRRGETTIGTLICTALRKSLELEVVLLDGGNIRGNSDYPDGTFSLAALRKEQPFESEIAVMRIPGQVLSDALHFSRQKEGVEENAGYLQRDDRVTVDASKRITHINGEPIDPQRLYLSGMLRVTIGGMNNNQPIIDWTKTLTSPLPTVESCPPAKPAVLNYFARKLWEHLPPFEEIDRDKDGSLSREEVKNAYISAFSPDVDGDNVVSEVETIALNSLVDRLIDALDLDGDDKITKAEYEKFLGSSAHTKKNKKGKNKKDKGKKKEKKPKDKKDKGNKKEKKHNN